MTETYPTRAEDKAGNWRGKAYVANLEADVAYFQARLELLGEPETINQLAQRRLFVLLHEKFADLILKARLRMLEDGRNSS